jgi:hypothetical protein
VELNQQILALGPTNVASHNPHALAALAGVLHDLGDMAEVEQRFQQCGRLQPAQRSGRLTR